jgi:multiple sugar transport system substrate-binding protein
MFDQLVREFNATHPTIRVEYQLVPLSEYHDKLVTALGAGSGPDAGRFKDCWLGEFVKLNALEPLPTYIPKWPGRADVIENLWNTGKITEAGPVYMMPHQFITFYLYYCKDWFAKAGLRPPATFDDFLAAAKKLTDPAKNQSASACGAAPVGRISGWPSWWRAARASWTRRERPSSIMRGVRRRTSGTSI